MITGGTEAVEIDASQNVDIKAGNLDVTGGTVKESGTDISPIGKHMTPVVAGDMLSRTTSGAQAASIETSTNKVMVDFLAFDTSADEFAQFILPMPKSWNESTVTYVARWTHPSTATNFGVTFCLQGIAFGNSDALDAAFGTAVCVDDTGGTTDDLFVSPESTAITVGGTPAESDSVTFQLYRDVSDANDDLAVDARITAIDLYITSNAATDD